MKTIYTNKNQLLNKGPNQSFGNHLLHLFFVYNISKNRNINLGITCNSNLDELLQLNKFKKEMPNSAVCIYNEVFGGNIENFIEKEKINLSNSIKLLYDFNINLPNDFYLEGWFYHNKVKPNPDFFSVFKIHDYLIQFIINNNKDIINDDVVVIHYRKGDFINHSIGWGNLVLPIDYYIKAIEQIKKNIKPKKYIIVSDDPKTFFNLIKPYTGDNIEISNNTYIIDWLILYFCKNLICSNSSFCWTAGLFNKINVIQPKGYLIRNLTIDKVFPPDIYYDNSFVV